MVQKPLLLILLILGVASCNLFRKTPDWDSDISFADSIVANEIQNYQGETWVGANEILYTNYQPSETKYWDLKHTELSLGFDFAERSNWGHAELTLSPHWDAMDSVVLDARNFRIKDILEIDSPYAARAAEQKHHSPRWSYTDSAHLKVFLSKKYNKNQTLKLRIYYSAHPYSRESSGNDALSGDRGIYFINHDLRDPSKPRQIWTQGETQSSSSWFPTLDAPNQKTTLKISLFVPDTMVTLSNGKLVSSIPSTTPGIRMDVWEQALPHAPYLTMIAIGNWSVTKDKWNNKEVNYLVEKKYEPYAKMIFGNTPKMIEFFSNYTGVAYPWDKYSQVVVRDFVSGAMENTTATVHMEQVQHTAQEHIDNTYENYISHELFHQWFGDMVTTESWSNITLNESFANYGEYLWREHFYGLTDAQNLLQDLRDEYEFAGMGEGKHLVRYSYQNEGDLFDNISYQKGACILHMLRYTLGERTFREGLKQYLNIYKFQSAEVANLRMVFEDITGKDLHWFFNQWYFDSDHPKIQLGIESNDDNSKHLLRIEQIQTHRNCYAFPVKIKWGIGDSIYEKMAFVDSRVFFADLNTSVKPDWFVFDADNSLLCNEQLIHANITEVASSIEMLSKAYDAGFSEGTRFRLFDMACNIADLNDGGINEETITLTMRPFCKKALRSSFDHTVQRVLSFSVNHPWYLDFGGDPEYGDVLAIVKNRKLSSDSRISAINKLYYLDYGDNKLLPFTADSSPAVSIFTIGRLKDKTNWLDFAKSQYLSEQNGQVALAWMKKMILNSEYRFEDGLYYLVNNPNVTLEHFDQGLNTLFYYCPENLLPETLQKLVDNLRGGRKKQEIKMIRMRLQEDVEALDAYLSSAPISDTPDGSYVWGRKALRDGYMKVLQNIDLNP